MKECFYDKLNDFCRDNYNDSVDFIELKEKISDVQIKSKQTSKISKFTLQIYAFVYQRIMNFPRSKFEFETVTTGNLFEYVHKIINVTGKIIGYTHDFCNLQVRENKDVIPVVAHNFFGFDMIFLLKTIRLSTWRTKDINIGGKNLTDLNYASIDKFKFIDTIKYYQSSLEKLSETLSEKEKENITKLTVQFLLKHDYSSIVWKNLSDNQRNKIIEIIVSSKGVIPYEKIETINSLDIKPEDGIFFSKDEFFSTLKGKKVDEDCYKNVKTLYVLLKMRNLSDLNDLYNAQDVIILLEMMEIRFQQMQDRSGYNLRIINSASKLSGCIQREKSKCILALPINNTQMEIFEKTCGGCSSVNTRLSFDTEILMPNLTERNYHNMNIDQRFKAFKRDDSKVMYSLKLDDYKSFQKKRIISKIIRFDENNQYGFAMTKPMPTGCIKENNSPTQLEFNLLLEKVSLEDPIDHLFIVDIEFDEKNATRKQYMYNEIFPPIIEKQKILDANEWSLFQLLELFDKTNDGKPKSYRCTAKSHATMFPKKFIPLYLEDLRFLIKRAGWVVTKLYSHFTFEQDAFKKDFVLMNQKSRQNAKNSIEKDFYKLMNNANFGFDCRNNANNLKFEPLIDEINELTYIKKYHNLFDSKISNFVSCEILEKNINQEFEQKIALIKEDDRFKNTRIAELENEKKTNIDSLNCLKQKEKKSKKRKLKDVNIQTDDAIKNKKNQDND